MLLTMWRVHVNDHPADKKHENMTVDQILTEALQHVSPYQPKYYEQLLLF